MAARLGGTGTNAGLLSLHRQQPVDEGLILQAGIAETPSSVY